MKKRIVNKNIILSRIASELKDYTKEQIGEISDLFMKEVINSFIQEESFQYSESYPIFKAKKSIGKLNESSPRVQRNDRVVITSKIILDTKTVEEGKC